MDKNNKSLSQNSSDTANASSQTNERRITLNLSSRISSLSKPASAESSVGSTQRNATSEPKKPQNVPVSARAPQTQEASAQANIAPSKEPIRATPTSAQEDSELKSNSQTQAETSKSTQSVASSDSQADVKPQTSPQASQSSAKAQDTLASKQTQQSDSAPHTSQQNNKSAKGKKVKGAIPPWMTQYQKKAEDASAEESNVHLDLTSKTKQEQERAELQKEVNKALEAAKKHLAAKNADKQQQRLKEMEQYHIDNSFDLDLLAFQKSFDNIDQYLTDYINDQYDMINQLIEDEQIPQMEKFSFEDSDLEFFTSKKHKYKHKQHINEEQLNESISKYLKFKYKGVFKAVCLYQLFCEQFRIELFNQLEKQCLDFASSGENKSMSLVQRFIDDIEPLEVAANKLMRISLSESQIIANDLAMAVASDNSDKYAFEVANGVDKAMMNKSYDSRIRRQIGKFANIDANLFKAPPQSAGDDAEVQAFVDKINKQMPEDNADMQTPDKSEEFADLYTKSALNPRSALLPYSCKQLQDISSILSTFDGYYDPFDNNISPLDDVWLNNGDSFEADITHRFNHSNENIFPSWFLFWRLNGLTEMLSCGRDNFISGLDCLEQDKNHIHACPDSNFKLNIEQLNLSLRRVIEQRDVLHLRTKSEQVKNINIYRNEYSNFIGVSFSMFVQFVHQLESRERWILSAIISSVDNNFETTLSIKTIRDKLKTLDIPNEKIEQTTDSDILCFIHKLVDTVFVERLTEVSKEMLTINNDILNERIRLTPVLIKNFDDVKTILKMSTTVNALTKRMTQELLYINPALRTVLEDCETVVHNRKLSTTSNIISSMERRLKYEVIYSKLRNFYLEYMSNEGKPIEEKIDIETFIEALHSLPSDMMSEVQGELFAHVLNKYADEYEDDDDFDFDDEDEDDEMDRESGMFKLNAAMADALSPEEAKELEELMHNKLRKIFMSSNNEDEIQEKINALINKLTSFNPLDYAEDLKSPACTVFKLIKKLIR